MNARHPHPQHSGHTLSLGTDPAATPAWMNTNAWPLEAAPRGSGHEHLRGAATPWPIRQHPDGTWRADIQTTSIRLGDTNTRPLFTVQLERPGQLRQKVDRRTPAVGHGCSSWQSSAAQSSPRSRG